MFVTELNDKQMKKKLLNDDMHLDIDMEMEEKDEKETGKGRKFQSCVNDFPKI